MLGLWWVDEMSLKTNWRPSNSRWNLPRLLFRRWVSCCSNLNSLGVCTWLTWDWFVWPKVNCCLSKCLWWNIAVSGKPKIITYHLGWLEFCHSKWCFLGKRLWRTGSTPFDIHQKIGIALRQTQLWNIHHLQIWLVYVYIYNTGNHCRYNPRLTIYLVMYIWLI